MDDLDEESDAPEQAPREKSERKKTPTSSKSSTLHQEALRAAAKGDCKRVQGLGNTIRKLDSGYYDRVFLSDDKLKACRSAF